MPGKKNNSFFYPGINLGFIFSEFLPRGILTYGKIRLGYALAGNDAPAYSLNPYYRAAILRNGGYGFTNYPVGGIAAFEKYWKVHKINTCRFMMKSKLWHCTLNWNRSGLRENLIIISLLMIK